MLPPFYPIIVATRTDALAIPNHNVPSFYGVPQAIFLLAVRGCAPRRPSSSMTPYISSLRMSPTHTRPDLVTLRCALPVETHTDRYPGSRISQVPSNQTVGEPSDRLLCNPAFPSLHRSISNHQ